MLSFSSDLQNGTVLFSLGISVGIVASLIANKTEVDKLKELLKQTENLVQDLQEELEMKDSLTVRELKNENYELQDTYPCSLHERAPCSSSPQRSMNISRNGKELYDEKDGETLESMSKIEAELEAEFERLGLNVNTSSLEIRLSDIIEVCLLLNHYTIACDCMFVCISIQLITDCLLSMPLISNSKEFSI